MMPSGQSLILFFQTKKTLSEESVFFVCRETFILWENLLIYPESICKNRRPVRRFLHLSRGKCGRLTARSGQSAACRPLQKLEKVALATFSTRSRPERYAPALSFIFPETPAVLPFSPENPSAPDRTRPARLFHPWNKCPPRCAGWEQTQRLFPPFPARKPP